jgi:hypothetical protein
MGCLGKFIRDPCRSLTHPSHLDTHVRQSKTAVPYTTLNLQLLNAAIKCHKQDSRNTCQIP